MLTDALGNEIIMGNHYGHARYQNGHNRVTIGIALKETKTGMLSITPENVKSGLYKDLDHQEELPKVISVKSILVFPVDITKVK